MFSIFFTSSKAIHIKECISSHLGKKSGCEKQFQINFSISTIVINKIRFPERAIFKETPMVALFHCEVFKKRNPRKIYKTMLKFFNISKDKLLL